MGKTKANPNKRARDNRKITNMVLKQTLWLLKSNPKEEQRQSPIYSPKKKKLKQNLGELLLLEREKGYVVARDKDCRCIVLYIVG